MEFEPITGVFGAEVTGVDLAAEADEKTVALLSEAFLEYKMLPFANQHQLSPQTFARFARNFGRLEDHPFYPPT
jgi:alpha-ketoglutarate-dependent taurine dioxygenase